MRIAFLTCSRQPALYVDDHAARAALEARGVAVVPWVWDGPEVGPVDAAVVRSCWDYHEKLDAFLAFVFGLEARGVRLYNPAATVRWNVDKGYLRDLAARGATIPKTAWLAAGAGVRLAAVLDEHGLDEVVVKPRVSLSAVDTFRASRATAASLEGAFASLSLRKALLVQEFVPEIARGETSLVYLGGRYSHAVRKTPAAGDFRVQSDHGGTLERVEPPAAWIAETGRVLGALPELLYARADVVESDRGLAWMELEAVDAELFFQRDDGAAARFAEALLAAASAAPPAREGTARGGGGGGP